jgi:aldose 1-epimerase
MVRTEQFGKMPDGREVSRFVLTNANGQEASVIDYAAALVSWEVPDRRGTLADIVLGFDSIDGYLNDKTFQGAVAGRYANRIANARFSIDGLEHRLVANNGPNTLHGGSDGLFKKVWEVKATGESSITLAYLSPDGEEGFPGNLAAQVTYTLTEADELRLEYHATTDRPTVVNLTGHGYFNLAGESDGDILDHELLIDADFFLPTDEAAIPTGEIRPVKGTPFDFTAFRQIGSGIQSDHQQIKFGNGYDRCWVLRKKQVGQLTRAALLREPDGGRTLEVWTTGRKTVDGKCARLGESGKCWVSRQSPERRG